MNKYYLKNSKFSSFSFRQRQKLCVKFVCLSCFLEFSITEECTAVAETISTITFLTAAPFHHCDTARHQKELSMREEHQI
jgi:hypothetical protein